MMTVCGLICTGIIAAAMWMSGGRRSDTGVGPANVKMPIRIGKTLPYVFGAVVLLQLLKLLEVLTSK